MTKWKKPFLFALCLLPIAIVAGVFVGLYQLDTLSDEVIAEFVAEAGSTDLLIVIGAVQTVGYALFCGFFGYLLADKIGLWKPIRLEKKKLLITLAISLIGGIQSANLASLTVNGVLASILYGGIIEEVLMRLFFMSLIAFVLWKLFFRKYDRGNIPTSVFVIANVVAAILFAAGHLPATLVLFGELTPLILFRCFLLNGGFGLVFGWLYRKYGIVYAMTGHALFHVVSKGIWLLFL